jgi:hypothetical protein
MQNNIDLSSYLSTFNDRIGALESLINEIGLDVRSSRKKRFSKKTQSVVLNGMTRALCVTTIDPLKEHRVQFYHPLLHDPQTPVHSLPFARHISAMGGIDDCGLVWVPPAGSTLCLLFENGNRAQPYYMGTTWHRDRGPGGSKFGFPVQEYFKVSSGHRGGYLVGPDDESQVLPPWNTENYNGFDTDSQREFENDAQAQQKITYPNIYGFKTPEKHMLKLVDGDAKCNRRFKRIELLSGGGNWMMMKDDHLHYGGQYANCGNGGEAIDQCATTEGDLPYFTDIHGKPIEKEDECNGQQSSNNIIGGHPSTPEGTKYADNQKGYNKYFKHKNECRPYKGPGTPQNNRCDLPQSGIQILTIGGHTMVMDDSVEEPQGKPEWERSTKDFDWGCNNKFLGRVYIKSATGHSFNMSDIESEPGLRGKDNFIRLKTANGNEINMNDHTLPAKDCKPCPPNYAGEERGVKIRSTSNHVFFMCDENNQQCSPCRKEGGVPISKATDAYILLKTGYGLETRWSDDNSQEDTQNQWIQITHPQCSQSSADPHCNKERGPHFLRFQGRPQGEPGIIFLRAGGHSIRQTYDMDIVLVGDKEKNPSDKFTYVSKKHIRATEDVDYRYSGELHIFFAEKYILLMAGRDCPPAEGKECCAPCLFPVVVGRCPVVCPYTQIIHWTEKSLSERVFASAYNQGLCDGDSGKCPPGGDPQPCKEQETTQTIDTGTGNSNQTGSQQVQLSTNIVQGVA